MPPAALPRRSLWELQNPGNKTAQGSVIRWNLFTTLNTNTLVFINNQGVLFSDI